MEPWLIFSVLCYLSFAISTSIDKHFMNERYEPVSVNTFKMFFNGVILLVMGLLFFELNITSGLIFWSFILGGLYAVSGIIYFRALELKDVETVVPYYQAASILLIFASSIIMFNEVTNTFNYAGVVLMLAGVYLVLSKDGIRFPKIDKAIYLILALVVLHTVYSLLVKRVLFGIEPINIAIMMYFSSALILSVYMLLQKKGKGKFSMKSSKIITASFFGAMGTFLLYSALAIGDASKVFSIAGLQSAFIFIIASLFLKERFRWHRLGGTIVIVAGVFLISI